MIYGFVMIQNPEKTFNGSHAVEEVIHEEVEAEEGVADLENLAEDEENATDRIVTDLTNGTMDPQAEKYRELGLLRIQKHGIKGNNLNTIFNHFANDRFLYSGRDLFGIMCHFNPTFYWGQTRS